MRQKISIILFWSIIVIASFLRLFQLGNYPHGFLNDEVVAIANGYSLWQTGGHGIDGTFLPLNIHGAGNDLTPVPVYILAPFVGILGLSPFAGRLPYALAGIGSVILLYFIVKNIFQKTSLALLSMSVFALSPWALLVSRGAWESGVSLFFYLLGIVIFLSQRKKGNILWSIPAFLLGFYSYNAGKIFFVGLIMCLLLIFWDDICEKKKQILFFVLGNLVILGSFILVLKISTVTRQDVLIWQDKTIAQKVVFEREKSSASRIVKAVYSNKPEVFAKQALGTYLGFFSPAYLFVNGDSDRVAGYGQFFWGALYFFDLPFFLLGFYYAIRNFRKKTFGFFIAVLLIAPIPSALSSSDIANSYLFRSLNAIPFLTFFVALGLYASYEHIKNTKGKRLYLFVGIVGIIYFFFITKYLYNYYYQFSTFGGESWLQSSRELSEYVGGVHTKFDKVYIGRADKELVLQYAFFNKIGPLTMQQLWSGKSMSVGNVIFINDCFNKTLLHAPGKHLFLIPPNCNTTYITKHVITDAIESTQILWRIYEN